MASIRGSGIIIVIKINLTGCSDTFALGNETLKNILFIEENKNKKRNCNCFAHLAFSIILNRFVVFKLSPIFYMVRKCHVKCFSDSCHVGHYFTTRFPLKHFCSAQSKLKLRLKLRLGPKRNTKFGLHTHTHLTPPNHHKPTFRPLPEYLGS